MRRSLGVILTLLFVVLSFGSAALAKEPVTVRWLVYGTVPLFEKVLEQFHAENPDIKVEFDLVTGEYTSTVAVRAVAGALPDVVILNWGTFRPVKEGYFLDLTPYVERDGIDMNDYVVQTNLAEYQGRIMGLPWGTFMPMLFYNKEHFDESGVSYPTADWHWSDLENAAARTVRRTGAGEVSRWGFNNPLLDYEYGWRNFVAQNGGALYNEDFSRTLIDSPEVVEAITYLVELTDRQLVQPPGVRADFLNWDYSMNIRRPTPILTAFAENQPDWEWGVEILPQGVQRAAGLNTLVVGVNASTEHPEEAWRLVKYLSSPDAAKHFALLGRAMPSHAGAYGDPEFFRAWGDMVGQDLTHLAQTLPLQMANPFWIPVHEKEGDIMVNYWRPLGERLLRENVDPRVYLEGLASQINAILAQ